MRASVNSPPGTRAPEQLPRPTGDKGGPRGSLRFPVSSHAHDLSALKIHTDKIPKHEAFGTE